MKVRYALLVAGDRTLSEFSWGEQLVTAIDLYFPRSESPTVNDSGNQLLRRIEALGDEVGSTMLDVDVVPAAHPSVVRDQPPEPAQSAKVDVKGVGQIKLTLPGLMTIALALILLFSAIMLVGGIGLNDPSKSGQEKIELFTSLGKALKEVFDLVVDKPAE